MKSRTRPALLGVLLGVLLLLSANAGHAEPPEHQHGKATDQTEAEETAAVLVEPGQAVVRVNGIVCSFCAYGAEKALSKLDVVDSSKFGDGVLVDINARQITLALAPGKQLPVAEVYERIKKAGYDPVTVHFRVLGRVERSGETLLLTDSANGQVFSLSGAGLENLGVGEQVDVQAHLDAEASPGLKERSPVEVVVDRLSDQQTGTDG